MSQVLASQVAPSPWRLSTTQIDLGSLPQVSAIAAPIGISLHHFTELVSRHLDVTTVELHRVTTILTKQVSRVLGGPAVFESIRSLVTDPDRIAISDGRTAAELCGQEWAQVRSLAIDRADAAVEGANRYGEATVLQLAAFCTAAARLPWWGTQAWEDRVDAWARSIRFAPRLKRAARHAPELVDAAVLRSILGG
jgi:hypothetical protein